MKKRVIIKAKDWENSIYKTKEWEQSVKVIMWEHDFGIWDFGGGIEEKYTIDYIEKDENNS